jgi:hypothetical protein
MQLYDIIGYKNPRNSFLLNTGDDSFARFYSENEL